MVLRRGGITEDPASSQHHNSGGGGGGEVHVKTTTKVKKKLHALATHRPIWGQSLKVPWNYYCQKLGSAIL